MERDLNLANARRWFAQKDLSIWKALLNQDAGTNDFGHQSSVSRDVEIASQVDKLTQVPAPCE